MLNILDTAITHTDESNIIIKESFGDRVDAGETLADTAKNIREAYSEGKLNDTDIEAFNSRVSESSVMDDRVIDMIDPEYSFKYTDEELSSFNTKLNEDSSNVGYDKTVAETSDNLGDYDPEKVRAELDQEIETIFQEKTGEDGTIVELDPETAKIKEEMIKDTEITKIQEAYAKCRVI